MLSEREQERPRRRLLPAAVAVAAVAGVVVFFAAVLLVGDYLSAMPAVCGACHEMAPEVQAWRTSPHTAVGCYWCHGDPRPVYVSFPAFAERARRMGGYLWAFLNGTESPPQAVFEGDEGLPDAVCERCHRPERKATREGIVIDHVAHAKRNMSCVSCHRRTAHPGVMLEGGYALMEECFKCHSLDAKAKARGRCDNCHAKDFDLVPRSHKAPTWLRGGHGQSAIAENEHCALCHQRRFCDDCHGIAMPHPEKGWQSGKTGHVAAAAEDRKRCARCHARRGDLCSGCHHKDAGYRDGRVAWIHQHPGVVRSQGVVTCLSCHDPLHCSTCHLGGGGSGPVGG